VAETGSPTPLDLLLGETRALREELHDLVARLRAEQTMWDREAATLPRRERLTSAQRQRFRAHLSRLQRRRTRR